jgi:K+-sensing histidine kinase KdpD
LAVALSALALILMLLLRPLMEPTNFFLFLAAVAVSAMYGGLGPGLVATLLSALAAFFFLPPNHALLGGTEQTLRLGVFLSTGMIVSWLAHNHKRAEDRLRARSEELERWVAQRSALEERLEWRASHDHLTDLHNQTSLRKYKANRTALLCPGDRERHSAVRAVGDHVEGEAALAYPPKREPGKRT